MMKELREWHCIDYEALLLMKSKSLNIRSEEVLILLYIIRFTKMDIAITPSLLMEYISFTSKEVDLCLSNLIKGQYIVNTKGLIELGVLFDRLLMKNKVKEEVTSINLIQQFEIEFGKPLTPMELTLLQEWKEEKKYDDETIIKALKEAVKSNVLKFRYIDTILENWNKNGIKQRFIEQTNEPNQIESSEFEWWKK